MTDTKATRPSLRDEVTGLVRTRILDAIGVLLDRTPWDKISMAALAREAGVSRQTVYNEFGSRDDLAVAYVFREAAHFLDAVERAVTDHVDDMHLALRSAIEVFLAGASEHPVLRRLAHGDTSDSLLGLILSASDAPVLEVAAERLAAVMARTWPGAERAAIATLADAAVRLAVSHATQPIDAERPEADVDAIVHILAPFVDVHGCQPGSDA